MDKAAAHLEHLRSFEKKKELDYAKAREEVFAQEAAVDDIHAQHEQAKQKVLAGSTAGSDLGEQRDGPVIESDRSEVMSDVDSDLAPADWALPSETPNATPSASACADPTLRHPPPAQVTQLNDKVRCDETGRMKVWLGT